VSSSKIKPLFMLFNEAPESPSQLVCSSRSSSLSLSLSLSNRQIPNKIYQQVVGTFCSRLVCTPSKSVPRPAPQQQPTTIACRKTLYKYSPPNSSTTITAHKKIPNLNSLNSNIPTPTLHTQTPIPSSSASFCCSNTKHTQLANSRVQIEATFN
jgi:hypothetical protein